MRNKIITLDEFSDKEIEEVGKGGKGFKETGMGLIPEDWGVKKLGELCSKSQYGYTTKTSSVEIGPIILRITDIDEFGNVDFNKVKFCRIEENELNKFLLEDGDILIARSGSIGKTYLHKDNGEEVIFASYLVRFKPNKELAEPKFLFYYLHSPDFSKYIEEQKTGVTQFNLNAKKMSSFTLRIPPLPIQQKIVARLDAFFEHYNELRKEKQKAKEKYEQIIQSVIASLIPQKELPDGWEFKPLDEICNLERGKFAHRPRNEPRFYGGKYPFIQTGDITKAENGRIKEYKQTLNEEGLKISRMFPKGTVVISIAANIGDTAILDFDSAFPDSIVGITSIEGKSIPEYIEITLRLFKADLNMQASATAQKNINLRILKPFKIPIPSMQKQKKIVNTIEKISQNIQILEQQQKNIDSQLEQLPKAVLSKAFRGELVS